MKLISITLFSIISICSGMAFTMPTHPPKDDCVTGWHDGGYWHGDRHWRGEWRHEHRGYWQPGYWYRGLWFPPTWIVIDEG